MDPGKVFRGLYELRRIVGVKAPNNRFRAREVLQCPVRLTGALVHDRLAIKPSGSAVEHHNRSSLAGEASVRFTDDNMISGDLIAELNSFRLRTVPSWCWLGRHF